MKILLLLYRFPGCGGIETVTAVLAKYWVNKGYQVAIVSFCHEYLDTFQYSDAIQLYHLPEQNQQNSVCNREFLQKILNDFVPDIIINQEAYSRSAHLLLGLADISAKIITVEHNSPDARQKILKNYLETERPQGCFKTVLKRLLRPYLLWNCYLDERNQHRIYAKVSHAYVLLSEKYRQAFFKYGPKIHQGQVFHIPNPVTIPVPLKDVDLSSKQKVVLFVGRLSNGQKRIDRLLRIWKKCSEDADDWSLLIVGDGPDRQMLQKMTVDLGIPRVYFEGFHTDVVRYYSIASILCMTSEVEGWGLVLTECMTYGVVPVVFNEFAAASDIIHNKHNGLLIDGANEREFANSLSDLMKNTEMRAVMARNAMESSGRYSLESIGKMWENLFSRVVGIK